MQIGNKKRNYYYQLHLLSYFPLQFHGGGLDSGGGGFGEGGVGGGIDARSWFNGGVRDMLKGGREDGLRRDGGGAGNGVRVYRGAGFEVEVDMEVVAVEGEGLPSVPVKVFGGGPGGELGFSPLQKSNGDITTLIIDVDLFSR